MRGKSWIWDLYGLRISPNIKVWLFFIIVILWQLIFLIDLFHLEFYMKHQQATKHTNNTLLKKYHLLLG